MWRRGTTKIKVLAGAGVVHVYAISLVGAITLNILDGF